MFEIYKMTTTNFIRKCKFKKIFFMFINQILIVSLYFEDDVMNTKIFSVKTYLLGIMITIVHSGFGEKLKYRNFR